MLTTVCPFNQYFDSNGDPLDNGRLYFGAANQDPETNPITVYWDEAATQPAAQPIRTRAGYPVRSGSTPARVYVNADDYSVTCRTSAGALVFYEGSVTADGSVRTDLADKTSASKGAGMVGVSGALNYAAGTAGETLTDFVRNVKMHPWLAACDGVTDDSAALNAAFSSGAGTFLIDGTAVIASDVTLPSGVNLVATAKATIKSTGGNFILSGSQILKNIKFDMNGTAKQVYGEGADDVTTDRCEFTGSTNNGLLMSQGPRNYRSVHDWFHDNGKAGLYVAGTVTDAPYNITVDHPLAHDNDEGGVVVAGVGEQTSPAQTANYAERVTITAPKCWNNGTSANSGVEVFYAVDVTLEQPMCIANAEHGVSLQEVNRFAIGGGICRGNGEAGICMQSGYAPYVETQNGTIVGTVLTGNDAGLLFKEQCADINVIGVVAQDNTSYSARLVDIGGSGLKSRDITFVGGSFVPSGGNVITNSNGSTNVTQGEGLNHYGTTAQVNQMQAETASTAITIDTRGATQAYPEIITLTNSGTNVDRCLIAQAVNGRRLTLRADGSGSVTIRHNQGDGVSYAGFVHTSAANKTLGAWQSVTYVGNGTNFVQMD